VVVSWCGSSRRLRGARARHGRRRQLLRERGRGGDRRFDLLGLDRPWPDRLLVAAQRALEVADRAADVLVVLDRLLDTRDCFLMSRMPLLIFFAASGSLSGPKK